MLAAFGFGAWAIIRNWAEISQAWQQVSFWPILGALVLTLVGNYAAYPTWREILSGLGSRLPWLAGGRVFFLGQLGKYVPGGVWAIVAQVSLAKQLHVPRTRSGTAGLLAILVGVITAMFIAIVTLAFNGQQVLGRYAWILAVAAPVVVLLHPSVLAGVARLASRATKRDISIERIPERKLLLAAGIQLVGNLVLGLSLYLVIGTVGGSYVPILLSVGLFNLASAVGVLVPIAPAGAGVREVILIAGLSPFMDRGAALLIALMARVLSVVADFGLAGLAAATGRTSGDTVSDGLSPPAAT